MSSRTTQVNKTHLQPTALFKTTKCGNSLVIDAELILIAPLALIILRYAHQTAPLRMMCILCWQQDATLSQGRPRHAAVHFDMATCGFCATARISCWSLTLSADCSELSVNQIAHVRVNVSRDLKPFGGEIILEEFQPMWSRCRNYKRTDRRAIYCGITPQ